jgi:DNA-binding NarL/FixJ family response regulator
MSTEFHNVSEPIQVVLADDHDLVRSGIEALLTRAPDIRVVAQARDGEELLAVLARITPDIVVTDISMPRLDGLSAIAQIHERHPALRILVLSMYDTVDFVKRAVANGASGYLMKHAAPHELEHAVRTVVATGSYFSSNVAQLLLQRGEPTASDELTERQIEILVLLADGRSSKEIAYELGLSSKTVDVHRARIMERLRLNDVASLTRYAVRKGLVKA